MTDTGWLELRIAAEMFEDAQKARIAAVNKAERGGVDGAAFEAYTDLLLKAEKTIGAHMRKTMKRVVPKYIIDWMKTSPGIGDHLLARLLGAIGDPYIATPHYWEGKGDKRTLMAEEPRVRTIEQLHQYCGHGAPARRTKGMSADDIGALGKPDAKMLLHLLSEACMKQKGREGAKYRKVYEDAREAKLGHTHTVECVRCGPSGKPAKVGTPWNDGHAHAHALRMVGRAILEDLWTLRRDAEMAVAA